MGEYRQEMLVDLLPQYYKRLFPYQQYAKWLQYGNIDKNYMANREFSFTLADDIYIRYQSFAGAEELEAEMIKRCPHKIDLGAVYNARPSEHKKLTNFTPKDRELVFDIDLTDYDDVRNCCSGAKICHKCWRYMVVAVKILDAALREDFGFQHLLWVYSGRRGVHCWVSDLAARKLSGQARGAVAEYLQVVSGGEHKTKKVLLRNDRVHPSITRAVDIIKKDFEQLCLKDQDILGSPAQWTKVLALIGDDDLRTDLAVQMEKKKNSVERWNILRERTLKYIDSKTWKQRKTSNNVLSEIMLQFTYPRLDIAVSKGMNHLLKAPFCIHPKTGRVCVPFRVNKVDLFDPETVPTVLKLVEEIDAFTKLESESEVKKNVKAYKMTSMREPVSIFEEFLSGMASEWKGKLIEQSDAKMEF
jgi:DNA primase small subunit